MSSTLSDFAAQLHEFILDSYGGSSRSTASFSEFALELFRLQFAHNKVYRRFCQSRGVTPAQVANWTQIPAIPTSAFKELDLTSLSPEGRQRIFHSSGTSAHQPSHHFHSSESLKLYETSLLAWFDRHFMEAEFPKSANGPENARSRISVLSLTPSSAAAPNSSLTYMFDTIRRQWGAETSLFAGAVADGTWEIDFETALAFLGRSIKFRVPALLLGTAFNFVHFIDHCAGTQMKFALPSGSHVLETGGYKGRSRAIPTAELHKMISDTFGIPDSHIVTEYGMSELSSQAYDRVIDETTRRLFRFPPWARTQIISPETGEPVADGQTGLIRVFDLANVWSVMAIQTEDLAIARGDGFELLGRSEAAEPRGCSIMTP